MDIPNMAQRRSISPISPTRSECDHRSGLLSVVTRRFSRKSSHEIRSDYQDDSGCSTDSCSSAGAQISSNYSSIISSLASHDDSSSNHFEVNQSNMELASMSSCSTDERIKSLEHSKSSVHFRSTSSLRKALRNLSISTRSLSCTGAKAQDGSDEQYEYEKRVSFKAGPDTPLKKSERSRSKIIAQRSKTPPPQRRILRQPVSYMYLKGISGLPTQRVPRTSVCCPQGYR